jgi:predicted kinase
MKTFITFIALPGAGKTTLINERFNDEKYHIISADEIKLKLANYNDEKADEVHEQSVKLAEQEVYNKINEGIEYIIFDSGGINNSYTLRILKYVKDNDYYIHIIHLDVPVTLCIERISKRKRKVPTEEIIKKSYKIFACVEKQKLIADNFETIKYHTDKYLFLDMDGVIAEYQTIITLGYNIDFVNTEIFKFSKPVYPIITQIEKCIKSGLFEKIIILSVSPNSITQQQKIDWLKENLNFDYEYYFLGNKQHKVVMLNGLIQKYKLQPKEVTFIDDSHDLIQEALKYHINAIHPSKFLASY